MAKKLKLSPWHDASVNPVHVGVYQRRIFTWLPDIDWCFFDGTDWYCYGYDESDAYREFLTGNKSDRKGVWRGVLK